MPKQKAKTEDINSKKPPILLTKYHYFFVIA